MTCHEAHERARRSTTEWLELVLVGVQPFPGQTPLELRNCPACGSTLARPLADALTRPLATE